MLFNIFIQTLTKSKEFDQLNYRYDNNIQPRNWFQFADDVAAVTSSEYENLERVYQVMHLVRNDNSR